MQMESDVVENGVISPTDVRRSIHKNNLAKCTEVHITSRNNSYSLAESNSAYGQVTQTKEQANG